MNLHWIDWTIVIALLGFMVAVVAGTNKYMRNVADFLAAGRCAGRYLICVSDGMAGLGAITILAFWEMYSKAGFTAMWWSLPDWPLLFILSMSGFVIYRFRQTRAMTMAQFFEMRYSRPFRIFAGFLTWVAGTINFGIFPAVGARFFIYFCGLPDTVSVGSLQLGTFPLTMFVLLVISLFFTFVGGQIAVIVTDFLQGTFCMIVLIAACIFLLSKIDLQHMTEGLSTTAENESMIDPFKSSGIEGYSPSFFLMQYFIWFYCWRAWQGNQGYNCSATTPHEARMGFILGQWRYLAQQLTIPILAICAIVFLNHADLSHNVAGVQQILDGIDNEKIQSQMKVPLVLSRLLPIGLMGGLCATMLAAFISTHDTYLHSWGSIFIQDVVLPLRGRPLSQKQHLLLLRLSICGVAVFIFFFSWLVPPKDFIRMFFAVTGAIYMSGAGACILGGLYWKYGTTAGAWAAMIVGAVLAVAGIIAGQQIEDFPLNGQHIAFITSVLAIAAYFIFSILDKAGAFNLDRMLHRGIYAVEEDIAERDVYVSPLSRILGIGKEFTRWDKAIYYASIVALLALAGIFAGGLVYHHTVGIELDQWARFWQLIIYLALTTAIITTVWFTIGGLFDLKKMYRLLRTMVRDETDDGSVRRETNEHTKGA